MSATSATSPSMKSVLPPDPNIRSSAAHPSAEIVMPTLLGIGYGNYEVHPNNFILSFLLHALGIAGLLVATHFFVTQREVIKNTMVTLLTDYIVLPPSPKEAGGGGGGGDASKLQASKGRPPKFDMNQITPPAAVIKNPNPVLPVEQTIMVPQMVKLPTSQTQVGDPLSAALAASNGTGVNSGVGSGNNGGIGSGSGHGLGPGSNAGTGGGIFHVGGGVSSPRPVYAPDPEYSDEARKAKYQGTVVLHLIIGPDGRPRDIRIQRSLGLGLDEKAIETVRTWRFDPARKDGQPVAVAINVEVNFNLY